MENITSPAVNPQDISVTCREQVFQRINKNGPIQPHCAHLGPCHPWPGCVNHKGYGRKLVTINGKRIVMLVHRIVYAVCKGPIPENMRVLHHCDLKICQNPEHMYLGTNVENARDAALRERRAKKLTNAQALELRSLWETMPIAELAAKYGIATHYAYKVATGRARYHVAGGVRTSSYRQRGGPDSRTARKSGSRRRSTATGNEVAARITTKVDE